MRRLRCARWTGAIERGGVPGYTLMKRAGRRR